MVRLATVRDFRVDASRVFQQVAHGDKVVVTRNGKPIGVLDGISEEDLEDFLLARQAAYRRRHAAARQEHRMGKTRTFEEILGR